MTILTIRQVCGSKFKTSPSDFVTKVIFLLCCKERYGRRENATRKAGFPSKLSENLTRSPEKKGGGGDKVEG